MPVTIETERTGWIRSFRHWWPQLVDYRAAQHRWWPNTRIARVGGHLAVSLQALSGTLASARIAAVNDHGIATTRRVLRTGAAALLAAITAAFTVIAWAASTIATAVGLDGTIAGAAVVGTLGAGSVGLLWPLMSDADRHVRTTGAATRTRCWADAHIHVDPHDRGNGHARQLADAAIRTIPADEPVVLAAATPKLLATYRRWWPDARQLGDHQLYLNAGSDRTVHTTARR